MARNRPVIASSGRTVLIIDDTDEFLRSTERVVAREGHRVLVASSGAEGLAICRSTSIDVVLVDYFMPGMTGEEFVAELRTFDPTIQVVLQTGYASTQPPREMLRRLDIQGYHDKNDGPEKLLLWVDVGLKGALAMQHISKSRQGLRYILSVTPELHRIQPLTQLLQGLLLQTAGLLGVTDAFLAVSTPAPGHATPNSENGFIAMVQPTGDLLIRASTGRFHADQRLDACLDPDALERLDATLRQGAISTLGDGTVIPLRVGENVTGVIYLDRATRGEGDEELLAIFANQAAVAIQNVGLYELAAIDALTSVYSRVFLEQSLLRTLRAAYRSGDPVSVLAVDLDGMKKINDAGGHAAGDRALVEVSRALREATRAADYVGRIGGDEFVVVLAGADAVGADVVIRRILAALEPISVGEGLPVRASVGAASLEAPSGRTAQPAEYFSSLAAKLLATADADLYRFKRSRALASSYPTVGWDSVELARSA